MNKSVTKIRGDEPFTLVAFPGMRGQLFHMNAETLAAEAEERNFGLIIAEEPEGERAFYSAGLKDCGSADEMSARIAALRKKHPGMKFTFAGSSYGVFGAAYYGVMCGADKLTLLYGPLSMARETEDRDARGRRLARPAAQANLPEHHHNIPKLARDEGFQGKIDYMYAVDYPADAFQAELLAEYMPDANLIALDGEYHVCVQPFVSTYGLDRFFPLLDPDAEPLPAPDEVEAPSAEQITADLARADRASRRFTADADTELRTPGEGDKQEASALDDTTINDLSDDDSVDTEELEAKRAEMRERRRASRTSVKSEAAGGEGEADDVREALRQKIREQRVAERMNSGGRAGDAGPRGRKRGANAQAQAGAADGPRQRRANGGGAGAAREARETQRQEMMAERRALAREKKGLPPIKEAAEPAGQRRQSAPRNGNAGGPGGRRLARDQQAVVRADGGVDVAALQDEIRELKVLLADSMLENQKLRARLSS